MTGVDTSRFNSTFDPNSMPLAEVVNLGYKQLVFETFQKDRAEEIERTETPDELLKLSIAANARILFVSNERFARAENLFSIYPPVFDPELYGRQGKIMDSWESARHNPRSEDWIEFEIKKPSIVKYASLSTRFHLGNQAPMVSLAGLHPQTGEWTTLIPETSMLGHALKCVTTLDSKTHFQRFKISMIPDGGFTRLGLFDELPRDQASSFQDPEHAVCVPYSDPIPHPKKPLVPKYQTKPETIQRNLKRARDLIDLASSAYGGKIQSASNEHYGPAAQLISPYSPIHMFDGFESARSRNLGHSEQVIVQLAHLAKLTRIEFDFKYFRNNNPKEIELFGFSGNEWIRLTDRLPVKAFAGNQYRILIDSKIPVSEIKTMIYPDGGINRIHVYGEWADSVDLK
jgi:allantoicase